MLKNKIREKQTKNTKKRCVKNQGLQKKKKRKEKKKKLISKKFRTTKNTKYK